jgi:hypothetical protein
MGWAFFVSGLPQKLLGKAPQAVGRITQYFD